MLRTLKHILTDAQRRGYAVGAFNVNNLEAVKAIIDAAVTEKSPVVIQTSEGAIEYAGMDYLHAMMSVAAKAPVPVAIHLDHGKDLKVVKAALDAGYSSVMYDGSTLPYAKNVANTKKVVAWAKKTGASVEAEIGAISGIEDLVNVSEKEAAFTDPKEAARFARETGCDALAISVGTAHGPRKSKAKGRIKLDIPRIRKIDKVVKVPLVLHGASGVDPKFVDRMQKYCATYQDCKRMAGAKGIPDDQIRKAVKTGICKINIDSDLRIAFTSGLRETLMTDKTAIDPRKLLRLSTDLMKEVARGKMRLFGSSGKARK
jgi:fructose-bisphosphate aldolase class II